MAQAHRRLGVKVSVFDMGTILPRDDQHNVEIVRQALIKEGIVLHERISIKEVKHGGNTVTLVIEKDGTVQEVTGSHLLVAAGRAPNTDGLELDKAGVKFEKRGITVDEHLKTSNRKIFAIGDDPAGRNSRMWRAIMQALSFGKSALKCFGQRIIRHYRG